jgi:hypothetical protein
MQKYCDVHDINFNYCENLPTKTIVSKGKTLNLCNECFRNVCMGAYGKELQSCALKCADTLEKMNEEKNINAGLLYRLKDYL